MSFITIPIGSNFVWILFFITAVIVITMAFAFKYHWSYYGIEGPEASIMKTFYFTGSFILLLMTFLLALAF